MASADKNDHNTEALERGEKVTGSVTGLTDAPSTSGGSSTTTSTPSTTPATGPSTTTVPSTPSTTTTTKKSTTTTAPTTPKAEEPGAEATNVQVNPAYVEAMRVGYIGETPDPVAQRTTLYPAHGDGDLSVGANTAARPLAAKTDAPDATAEASGIATAEGLDPANADQWANGPAKQD